MSWKAIVVLSFILPGGSFAEGIATSPWLQDQLFSFDNIQGSCDQENCKFSNLPITGNNSSEAKVTSDLGKRFSVSIVDAKRAEELFREITQLTHIPMKDSRDSCWAKAFEMGWFLQSKGLRVGLAYIQGKLFSDLEVNGEDFVVEWFYHVAPFILVRENGRLIAKIFDPSSFGQMVSSNVWAENFLLYPSSKFSKLWFVDAYTHYVAGSETQTLKPTDYIPALRLINQRELEKRMSLQNELFSKPNNGLVKP